MITKDLLAVCLENKSLLPPRAREFVLSIAGQMRRKRRLTGPQERYLKFCYDLAVSAKYGLPAPDNRWANGGKKGVQGADQRP